jgi:hypothetical protein
MASKTPTNKKSRKNNAIRNIQDKGMIDRLKAQDVVQKHIEQIHLNRRSLDEMAFYPAHDERKESSAYKQVHEDMVITHDLPCLVCGVKYSTLADLKENRYGSKQMETHHHIIEWALANAIDTDKFNKIMLPNLKHRHPDNPLYQKSGLAKDEVSAWVDHSPDNLWVLCDVHHRAKWFGIHSITYPIWCPMDLLENDFDAYVRAQIAKEKQTSTKTKPKSKGAKNKK